MELIKNLRNFGVALGLTAVLLSGCDRSPQSNPQNQPITMDSILSDGQNIQEKEKKSQEQKREKVPASFADLEKYLIRDDELIVSGKRLSDIKEGVIGGLPYVHDHNKLDSNPFYQNFSSYPSGVIDEQSFDEKGNTTHTLLKRTGLRLFDIKKLDSNNLEKFKNMAFWMVRSNLKEGTYVGEFQETTFEFASEKDSKVYIEKLKRLKIDRYSCESENSSNTGVLYFKKGKILIIQSWSTFYCLFTPEEYKEFRRGIDKYIKRTGLIEYKPGLEK